MAALSASFWAVATPSPATAVPSTGAIRAGEVRAIRLGGFAGVPATAKAVALNVTATDPAGPGFLTLWPCGAPRPLASNVNYVAGQTVPNFVVAKLGADASVCVYSSGTADVVVDVAGYLPADSAYLPGAAPTRVLDTREGRGAPLAPLAGGGTLELQVGGTAGVPAGAATVVMNVTVANPVAEGYVTVFPCGEPVPLASNVNFIAGQVVPNLVVARLGAGGKVCIFSKTTTDLVADVSGYFPDALSFRPRTSPVRTLDTRTGLAGTKGPVAAGGSVEVGLAPITASAPFIPQRPGSAVLNVTATNPVAAGFLTVWPCGTPRPTASNVNYAAGQTVANLAITGLNGQLRFCVFTLVATDIVVDVTGDFDAGTPGYVPLAAPARVLDTRVPLLTTTGFGPLFSGADADRAVAAGLIGPITTWCVGGPNGYYLTARLLSPAEGAVDVGENGAVREIESVQVVGSGTSTVEGVRVGDSWAVAQPIFERAGYHAVAAFDSFKNITIWSATRPNDPRIGYEGSFVPSTDRINYMSNGPTNYCE